MLTNFTRNCWLAGVPRYEFTYMLLQQLGLANLNAIGDALHLFDELERTYQNALEKTRH